ncbi:hypothetical protein pdam_00015662 [Pocillopora damicornis]|uniref:Ig-like domain-containing protein n=1 Tax=Pocillopora damicornis TaxID=46731 RepID=A0A3M6V0H4_POCDA|nr:hypothetical protein pdam_00015662 [Pocillopora damicornis]
MLVFGCKRVKATSSSAAFSMLNQCTENFQTYVHHLSQLNRYLLACSAVSDPENVKHIGWYRCSRIDCEQHWDEFLIAHVQNMTETIPNNPNFEPPQFIPESPREPRAELHVTVKLHERHLLACSSFRNPENVKHISWYRCSSHDCEHDWDRFLIAHVQNMTETISNDPNFEVYTNGTLVIKKVLPEDDGKMPAGEDNYRIRYPNSIIFTNIRYPNSIISTNISYEVIYFATLLLPLDIPTLSSSLTPGRLKRKLKERAMGKAITSFKE